MAKPNPTHEIEIKLSVLDLPKLRRALKQLHAREIRPRAHESNTLYDTRTQDLRRRGQLIRIRTEQPAVKRRTLGGKQAVRGDAAILTYKAPARSDRGDPIRGAKGRSQAHYKINEEAEVSFVHADEMDRILRGLGLLPQFRYEKYRTTYVLPRVRDLKIELDETPIGNYLELEGSPASIDRAASLLGYASSDYIQATYGGLYLADCRRHGRKPANMLFPK
jgi:adenylate cyclase, class 2